MIATKRKIPKSLARDAAACAERFVARIRKKISPKHQFKKTDRINMQARYPQYREESEEEKQAAESVDADLATVVKTGYDHDLSAKFRRFFQFAKKIFKHDSHSDCK